MSHTVRRMQWLSDLVYLLGIWLSHLVVIFLFHLIYMLVAPTELTHPQNLYMLFVSKRYLYMLFPVLNPISLIRMLLLILAISFITPVSSFTSVSTEASYEYRKEIRGMPMDKLRRFSLALSSSFIVLGYLSSDHTSSIGVCAAALSFGIISYILYLPEKEGNDAVQLS